MDPFKVLIEVVKTSSYTKAAQNLYTSQPSISRDIKRLEHDYDVKVFEFKHSNMRLTSDGETLFRYALQKQRLEDRLRKQLKQAPHTISGELIIGSSYTYGEYRLSEHLADLALKYPQLYVHAKLDNSEHILEHLKHNRIDVGIVEKEMQDNALNKIKIEHDDLVLICRKGQDINQASTFYIRERGSGTRAYQEKGIETLNLDDIFLVEMNNTTLIKNMVRSGMGISIISSTTLTPYDQEHLSVIPLDIQRDFYLFTHKHKYIDDNLNLLIEHLKQQ
ncbi:LysR family transcriptional regulator [Staphylococcus simulans]